MKQTTMKNAILVISSAILILFTACNKSNNGIQLQAHDENAMMSIMHTMMDSMKMMTPTNDPEIDFAMMMKMHHMGATIWLILNCKKAVMTV